LRPVQALEPQSLRSGSGRAFRHEAHELGAGHADAPRRGLRGDARDDLLERSRLPVLDVHRHLNEPAADKWEAESAYAVEAAARLAYNSGDRLRNGDVVCGEIDVEGDERLSGTDEDAARAWVEAGRPAVRCDLARVDPPLQLSRPSAPEQRGPDTRCELGVQEDGKAELLADPVRERERGLLRQLELLWPDSHQGNDVGRADTRMDAVVAAEIDPLACGRDPGDERLDELRPRAREREDGAMMIRILVDVEHARMSRQRVPQRLDRLRGTALGEVRDSDERSCHTPYSRNVKEYYDRRADEYDDWYAGVYYEGDERERFLAEVVRLGHVLADLRPARTLDVACGTGFLTRHLPGDVTGLDWSERMLSLARRTAPHASYVRGDALELPFGDSSFDRVFTGHFYGHLEEPERLRFLAEARRVAPELVVADAPLRPDHAQAEWQQRSVGDGSVWPVYKRFFAPEKLLAELGGGEVLLDGEWFVVAASR